MSVADDILKDLTDRIARTIESFKGDLQAIRTGRANLHVLDAVRVELGDLVEHGLHDGG